MDDLMEAIERFRDSREDRDTACLWLLMAAFAAAGAIELLATLCRELAQAWETLHSAPFM